MGKKSSTSRVVSLLQHGYRLYFKILPKLSKIPLILSKYHNKNKDGALHEAVQAMLAKKAITHVRKPSTLGYYSRLFLVPKPMKRWRPVIDLSMLNTHLHVPTFKMETAESIRKSIRQGEWVTSIDLTDAYFHVPIHPQSQKYLRFQTKKGVFQFQALPFGVATAPLEFTRSSSQEPQNPSISGRLASSVTNKRSMSQRFGKFSEIGPRTRLAHQFPKIGIGSHTKSRFSGLSLRSSEGSGFSNPKETRSVKSSDCFHQKVTSLDSKKAHVTHRDISFLRKNSTSGKVTHETFSVVPKVTLEVSPVSIGAKSCSPGPKGVSGALARSKCAHLLRQQYSSILSEQRRRHPFHRNVCSYLENSGIHKFQKYPDKSKTCTWIPKCDSRLPIKKGQGHTNRVVPSPTDIQPNLQSLAHTNGRPVCNSSKLQTSNLCISCPRQKGLENRCIEYLLGRPRRLCLLSSSHPATSNSKNNNIPMQDDSTGPRVARDAMVLGSGGSLDQGTPTAPSLEDTSETTTFQQVPQQRGVPESTCVASGFQESNSGRFSSEVAERIKAPQRESSRKVYQSRWAIYGQWCSQNKVDITSTTVPQVAEFLNYLFTVKNLKPATITGYRTAIADALGSQGELISKSLELNRLIASFTRDRLKPNRSIPTWNSPWSS